MPRYFFDLHLGGTVIKDELGLEFDGLAAVRLEAVRVLLDFSKDALTDGQDNRILVHVRDNKGEAVLTAALALEVDVKSAG